MNNNKFSLFPVGIILIIVQLIGNFGNGNWNFYLSFASLEAFIYSLFYFIGYWLLGIIGVIIILVSIFSKPKSNDADDDDWD